MCWGVKGNEERGVSKCVGVWGGKWRWGELVWGSVVVGVGKCVAV